MSPTRDALLAPTAENPMTGRELSKAALATSLVNGLEIFDFTVFGFFATQIGDQFFPASNPMMSLLLAVGTFGVGFLIRPLGAILIGAYADRAGRRAAMLLTCWLMALGTAAIGLCPPFAMIGVAAPIIIVVTRIAQGLAAGGEMGAATTFAMEAGPVSRRGRLVGWQLTSLGAAALWAACLGLLLTRALSPASLDSWGWRMPYLFGILIAPVGVYVRRQLPEIDARPAAGAHTRAPLGELCGKHRKTLVLATLLMAWRTVPVYTTVYYMPSYLTRVKHLPAILGFQASSLSALLLCVLSPLSGLLADWLPRRKPLVLLTSGLTALLVYPAFNVIAQANGAWPILISVALVSALVALGTSVSTVLVLEAFPASVRASGFAISYAIGVALFGGTAQFIVTGLIAWTGNPASVGWFVAPTCLLSFFALIVFKERRAVA